MSSLHIHFSSNQISSGVLQPPVPGNTCSADGPSNSERKKRRQLTCIHSAGHLSEHAVPPTPCWPCQWAPCASPNSLLLPSVKKMYRSFSAKLFVLGSRCEPAPGICPIFFLVVCSASPPHTHTHTHLCNSNRPTVAVAWTSLSEV